MRPGGSEKTKKTPSGSSAGSDSLAALAKVQQLTLDALGDALQAAVLAKQLPEVAYCAWGWLWRGQANATCAGAFGLDAAQAGQAAHHAAMALQPIVEGLVLRQTAPRALSGLRALDWLVGQIPAGTAGLDAHVEWARGVCIGYRLQDKIARAVVGVRCARHGAKRGALTRGARRMWTGLRAGSSKAWARPLRRSVGGWVGEWPGTQRLSAGARWRAPCWRA
jgi:hypothetical protein